MGRQLVNALRRVLGGHGKSDSHAKKVFTSGSGNSAGGCPNTFFLVLELGGWQARFSRSSSSLISLFQSSISFEIISGLVNVIPLDLVIT